MWHEKRDMWHGTHNRWGEVNLLLKFQLPSSFGLGMKVYRRFGGKGLLSLLMNESLSTSEFFILIGIHLCHVVIGSILITIYLWETSLIRLETNFILYQLKLSLCSYQHQHHLFFTLQLIYWHFVEGLWILLSWNLYN